MRGGGGPQLYLAKLDFLMPRGDGMIYVYLRGFVMGGYSVMI